ncbi:MAG: hypothetical protein ACSLEW_02555 [Nocardioides sp.]
MSNPETIFKLWHLIVTAVIGLAVGVGLGVGAAALFDDDTSTPFPESSST